MGNNIIIREDAHLFFNSFTPSRIPFTSSLSWIDNEQLS